LIEERAKHPLEALEGRVDTLLGELREGREQRAALQSRLQALEAERLELREENRELGEQNRELEDHNRDLHERLAAGESGGTAYRLPPRRAQGLSALMGHRPRSARTPAPGARTPPDGPAQGDLEIGEAPTAQALLEQWYRRYDATFFKGHTRPLKVGIHEELAAREPWPEKLVRRALACYVNLPRYLKSVRDGAPRIDLAGEPAGTVDEAAAEHARKKLERLQAQRQKRPAAGDKPHAEGPRQAGTPSSPSIPPTTSRATPEAPTTLEEKLSALLAKHNGQDGSNKT